MARMLPIGEATELPLEVPETRGLDRGLAAPTEPPRPLGAQGPQVNRNTFQGPQQPASLRSTPVAEALAAEARTPAAVGKVARGAEGLGRVAGKAARVVGAAAPLAAGAEVVSHFNDYKIDDPSVDSSLRGTFNAVRAGDFSGAGRSLSKGALETGMDLGSAAANVADLFVPGKAPVSTAYDGMLRDRFGSQLANKSPAAAASAAPAVVPGTVDSSSTNLFAGQQPAPGGAAAAPNVVTRNGNSFSGTDIKEGFSYSNGMRTGGNVSVMPAGPTATSAEVMQAAKAADAYGPGAHTADGSGGFASIGGETLSSASREKFNRESLDDSMRQMATGRGIGGGRMGGRNGAQAQAAAAQFLASQEATAAGERTAGLRERGAAASNGQALKIAELNNATARRSNDQNNATTLRGQDITAGSARAANRLAVAKEVREQGNSDRTFEAGRSDADMAQKTSRESALQRNIEAANVGPDGKPDTAAAAEYRRGIDLAVAAAGLDGVHQLRPDQEQKLMASSDLLKVMRANSGMLPWKPDALKTINPLDLMDMRVLPNGDRQITRAGKAAGQTIPKRFFDTEEGNRFFGGTPTNKFDSLSERAR